MNKVGGTFGGWTEIILFVVLFAMALIVIGASMNGKYNQNNDLSFGLGLNNTLESVKSYQTGLDNNTQAGQAGFTDQGYLKITTTPAIISSTITLAWNFVSGSFINTLVGLMHLGELGTYVAIVFRLLYFITIAFILLKIVTRVVV